MKKNSRLISLLLCICMLFSCIVVSAEEATVDATTNNSQSVFSDIKGTESYADAIYVLSAFELIKGYQDGTFGPDGNITRAEFATMLVRALGQEDAALASAGTTEFTDVAADFWGSGYINIASGLKIINGYGDGTFGPDNNVTYEQAVKMVVCALGYEPLANESVTPPTEVWPMGYLNAAATMKILDGVKGEITKLMTRWQVAQLIYNSLEVNLMETVLYNNNYGYQISDTKTLLYTKLGLFKSTGELLADDESSILESGNLARKDQVIIDDDNENRQVIFENDKNLYTSSMVGHPVVFYYKVMNNGDLKLIYIMDKIKSNDVLTLQADQIDSSRGSLRTGLTINYYENENDKRTQSVVLAANPTVIKNGIFLEDPSEEDVLPYSGSIELISTSNTSESYDRVIVTSYETWVINSVNKTTKTIVDMYRTSGENTFIIDEDDPFIELSMTNTDGNDVSLNNLSKWKVLSIAETQGSSRKQLLNIIVSSKSKVGTVTQVDDEELIYIDEEPYKVSKYFQEYGETDFAIDDYGTFYFDKDDKIAAFEHVASNSTSYGFIKEVEYVRSESKLQLAILPDSSQDLSSEFYSAKKLKIDGVGGISASSAYDVLREVIDRDETDEAEYINIDKSSVDFDEGIVSQLVKYTINSTTGEITEIDTVVENTTVRDSDLKVKTELNYDTNDEGHKVMTYNSSTKTFTGNSSSDRFRISTGTYVFMIPNDRNEDEEYVRKTYSYFGNAKKYTVEAYNVDPSTNIAEAVVVYGTITDRFITDTSPLAFIMSNTSKSNASDSEYNRYLTAYCFGKEIDNFTSLKILWGESSAVSDFEPGDIIRYTTTSKGYINSDTVTRVFSIAEDADEDERVVNDIMNSNDEDKAPYQVFSGLLYSAAKDGNNWYIDIANTDSIDDVEDSEIETFAITSNYAQIFEYDAEQTEEIIKHTYSEYDFTSLASYTETNSTDAAEIFVYALDGNVRLVYIVSNR